LQITINKRKDAIMKPKDKLADFRSQELFVGIDVHKKSWTVTIRLENLELKTF